jgi:hypothetical protein
MELNKQVEDLSADADGEDAEVASVIIVGEGHIET